MKSEKVETFEDLWVWQRARDLVRDVYREFSDGTPGGSDWGFRRQIQRAAVSVMNNIAEGFERRTNVEFSRFLDIAKGSCGEVRSMFYVAEDLGYLPPNVAATYREHFKQLAGGIHKLATHRRE